MKKISVLILALSLSIIACKNEKKETKPSETETATSEKFVVKPEATSVKWTAYKTTDKVGVGGEFTSSNFEAKSGSSPQEALNNLSFSIPISSLFTNDATNTRDAKIKASFFGAMLDTEFLKGTLSYVDDSCSASLTMNGITHSIPLDVKIEEERRVTLTGVMNLKDWNALDALASLNKVCFDLHKGPDGVSKTWEDVAIEVSTYLRKN
ncbi:YceI family protein [Seonamhaeicola aphaedonensis]|uniref:YceI-like domain-containing protein n=1 Tax=Seonamhaeicola aphaedonensis TaxID=1461338 RepID=A0A3D9HA55_9FLAO|nr:YceI family protein [Seonamhaeicola aphaedonensis]RED46061.1 YceI-like domain-containing protein [Seonamhaeicola aphaedonensis]